MSTELTAKQAPARGPKERFYRYFQLESTALQEQMSKLKDLSNVGGERVDAIEHCLAGIGRLQKEGIKALQEKLDSTRKSLAPKSKFTFKSTLKKNNSAISLNDAAELAMQQRAKLFKNPKDAASSAESSQAPTPGKPPTPPNDEGSVAKKEFDRRGSLGSFLRAAGVNSSSDSTKSQAKSRVRTMSFAASKSVDISSHSGIHIILPSAAAHATSSGSLTNMRGCIVDMSIPTATGQPFAALSVKNVRQSLLICGKVSGATHVTAVNQSVVVVSTRQFRMHECNDCIVYLHADSKPIIEDCHEIKFAPLPGCFYGENAEQSGIKNQWDQVQDFKWLRAEHSPNWAILPSEHRVADDAWTDISASPPSRTLEGILELVGVARLGQ